MPFRLPARNPNGIAPQKNATTQRSTGKIESGMTDYNRSRRIAAKTRYYGRQKIPYKTSDACQQYIAARSESHLPERHQKVFEKATNKVCEIQITTWHNLFVEITDKVRTAI
jgi:hypothetical protein